MSFLKLISLICLIFISVMSLTKSSTDLRYLDAEASQSTSSSSTENLDEPVITVSIDNSVDIYEYSENFEKNGIKQDEFEININVENTVEEQ